MGYNHNENVPVMQLEVKREAGSLTVVAFRRTLPSDFSPEDDMNFVVGRAPDSELSPHSARSGLSFRLDGTVESGSGDITIDTDVNSANRNRTIHALLEVRRRCVGVHLATSQSALHCAASPPPPPLLCVRLCAAFLCHNLTQT